MIEIKSYMVWNQIIYDFKSYMEPYMVLKWIICKIIYRQIICEIIYAKSYTTKPYMVPLMMYHMVSYTCLPKHMYVPYVTIIYDSSYVKSYVKSYMNCKE